jgi:hypothetical protein
MDTKRSANRPGRHVLEPASRRPARRVRLRLPRLTPTKLLASAVAILIGVFGAVTAAAGSFAYLNASAPVGAASTVTAGNSVLTLQQGAGTAGSTLTMSNTVWNRMLPGDFAGQSLTINNTGDAVLSVSTRLSSAIAWDIRVVTGACPGTQLTGAVQTTTATTLATVAAGASTTVCVQATLPTTAANSVQGTSPVVNLIVDGVQVP